MLTNEDVAESSDVRLAENATRLNAITAQTVAQEWTVGMKLFHEWRKKRKLRKICKANHFNCLECIHHEDVFVRTSRLGVRCRLDDEDRIYLIMEEQ